MLALCSDIVKEDATSGMAEKLLSVPRPTSFESGNNQPAIVDDNEPLHLADLINEDFWLIFQVLELVPQGGMFSVTSLVVALKL